MQQDKQGKGSFVGKVNVGEPRSGGAGEGERFFFYILLALTLIFMVGVLTVMCVLNQSTTSGNTGPADDVSRAIAPDHPRQMADFSLTNWTRARVSFADLRGKYLVVNFLFTGCSLTCPVVNGYMSEVQRMTANENDIRLVSLTVDPRDDTPEVLAKYASRFGADPKRWYFLTGETAEVYRLIKTSFLNQDLDPSFGYMPGNFSHTERVAVVDARGAIRAFFDGLNQNTPAAVTNEIAELRKEGL